MNGYLDLMPAAFHEGNGGGTMRTTWKEYESSQRDNQRGR